MKIEDLILIETELSFAINTFLEDSDKTASERYIRNYILDFCLKHNLSIDGTLEKLNPLLQYDTKIEKSLIVPQEKEEQSVLIENNFFQYVTSANATGKEKETEALLNNFCNITGIDNDFASSIYSQKLAPIKDFLENSLYKDIFDYIKDVDKPQESLRNFIKEVSEVLKVPSDFVVSTLKNKYLEEKSKTTKTSSSPKTSGNPNVNSFPTDVDDDAR